MDVPQVISVTAFSQFWILTWLCDLNCFLSHRAFMPSFLEFFYKAKETLSITCCCCCVHWQQLMNQDLQITNYAQELSQTSKVTDDFCTFHPAHAEQRKLRRCVGFQTTAGSNRIWWTLGNGTLIPPNFDCLLHNLLSTAFCWPDSALFAFAEAFCPLPLSCSIFIQLFLSPFLSQFQCSTGFCSPHQQAWASSYPPRS